MFHLVGIIHMKMRHSADGILQLSAKVNINLMAEHKIEQCPYGEARYHIGC